jgi:TctA family transporter
MEIPLFAASFQGLVNIMHLEIWLAMLVGVAIGTFTAVAPQGLGTPLVYAMLLPVNHWAASPKRHHAVRL